MDKRLLTAQQLRVVNMLHNKRPCKSDLESYDRYEGRLWQWRVLCSEIIDIIVLSSEHNMKASELREEIGM
jgi:hypothetical protein